MKKTLIRLTSVTVFLAAFVFSSSAQLPLEKKTREQKPETAQQTEPPVSPCPKLEVRASASQYVRDGNPVKFIATLSGGDAKVAPMFNWSISSGVVNSGQGTATIDVDSTGAGADKSITATVQIGGFAAECTADGSVTVTVAAPAKKLDEFADLNETEEKERLDVFISNVTEKEQAYIFAYAGRSSPRGQATIDARRMRAYLLKAGTPSERVVAIDGGYREEASHELWLVPIGAEPPRSTPTLKAKDIVFPKTTPPIKKP